MLESEEELRSIVAQLQNEIMDMARLLAEKDAYIEELQTRTFQIWSNN